MEKIIEQKTFLGYINNDTQIGTSAYSLVEGTKNTLITGNDPQSYSVETRNGFVLFGEGINSGGTITSSYDRFANGAGKVIPVRASNYGIELYYKGKWVVPSSNSLVHEPYFTEWWDDKLKRNFLLYVHGKNEVGYWDGKIFQVTSITNNTITSDVDPTLLGYLPTGSFQYGVTIFNYTGISGNTFTGITPDPTGIVGTNDIVTGSFFSTSGASSGCNQINNKFDITATFKNHVFYGDYSSKEFWISNSFFTYDATPDIIRTTMPFNDITITGTSDLICYDLLPGSLSYKKVKIEIDGIAQQTILNDTGLKNIAWKYSTHNSPTRDTYYVRIVDSTVPSFEAFYNGTLELATQPIIPGIDYNLSFGVSFSFNSNNVLDYIDNTGSTLQIGPNDTYKWYEDIGAGYTLGGSGIDVNIPLILNGLTYKFGALKGHKLGEYIEYNVYPDFSQDPNNLPFNNFYESKPLRKPGEGGIRVLDSAPIAFIVQEDAMYINGQGGEWYEIIYVLSDDGTYEKIEIKRLKSAKANKLFRMANMTNTKNDIVFVTTDRTIESIGRVLSVDTLPQVVPLSDPIKKDIKESLWFANENGELNGHCIHYDNKTFFTDPSTQKIFIFDHIKGFWQPPQTGIPVSRFAIIEGKLCGHSSIGEGTYQLFTGTNDNGSAIQASIRIGYNNYGVFSEKKNVQRLFTSGFKNQRSNLNVEVLFGYNGCEGRFTERIDPIMCISRDDVSIGQSSLAYHGHANKKQPQYDWFEHMSHFDPHSNFYNVSIGYFDNSMDGYFRIVCTGMDASTKNSINSQEISIKANTQEPPDIVGVPNSFGKSNYINQPDYVDTVFFGEVYSGGPWSGGSDGGSGIIP